MLKLPMISLMFLIVIEVSSQRLHPANFYFSWKPNPTDFIVSNHAAFLSENEYQTLLECPGLAFDAEVDLKTNKIISVKYSFVSSLVNSASNSRDLEKDIATKVSKVLADNIGLTKVRSLDGTDPQEGVVKFLITLDFTGENKRKP